MRPSMEERRLRGEGGMSREVVREVEAGKETPTGFFGAGDDVDSVAGGAAGGGELALASNEVGVSSSGELVVGGGSSLDVDEDDASREVNWAGGET